MRALTILLMLAGAGCGDSDVGNKAAPAGAASGRDQAAAPGKSEQGPPDLQAEVGDAGRAGLLPPEAVIGSDSPVGDALPITFQSRQRPERLLAWYRSPERRAAFRVDSELQEGAERVLTGTSRRGLFTVRVTAGNHGGSIGTLVVDRR